MSGQDSEKSENRPGAMLSPKYHYTAAALVAFSVFASPFTYDAIREVYPLGELGYVYDTCEEENELFNRWSAGSRALCRLMSAP